MTAAVSELEDGEEEEEDDEEAATVPAEERQSLVPDSFEMLSINDLIKLTGKS